MAQPSKLYSVMALIAKHLNETNAKFICVIARGEDGIYNLYNADVVDIDELKASADAIENYIKAFNNRLI